MRSWISQVRKGLVELCVMAALEGKEAYGYELLQNSESLKDWLSLKARSIQFCSGWKRKGGSRCDWHLHRMVPRDAIII